MTKLRDSIDFEHMKISSLFTRLFVPTLLGLIFSATLNIADGIFVGRGCGAFALASVNIAAPIFLLIFGLSLLFGTGVSIVGAIHMAKGNYKAANINVTQAFTASFAIMSVLVLILILFPERLCYLFGGSSELEPYVVDYLLCISPLPVLLCTVVVGMFVIRLDGSPKFAMYTNIVPAVLNMVLDWLFIFPFDMGLAGAAIATTLSEAVAFVMVIVYMLRFSNQLHFYKLKFSKTSIRLTCRNLGYMFKIGFSTFIGESAIACMMIVGNFMFMKLLKEEGVAAYSVACYLFPLIFMFANAISQSALPIISYNYGKKSFDRIASTFSLSLKLTVITGIALSLGCYLFCESIIGIFLDKENNAAYDIAVAGLPYFSIGFTFFSLNIVCVGYYQSLEKAKKAISLMFLRGVIFVVPCFIALPNLIGEKGLWLAVPLSEILTFMIILISAEKDNMYAEKQI